MKRILLILLTSLSISHFCDGQVILGDTYVNPKTYETYTVQWQNWSDVYETFANVTWNVRGGSIISSDKHNVTIQWNDVQGYLNTAASVHVSEDLMNQEDSFSVVIFNNTSSPSESCTGILGPPVFTEDFGSGSNPGPALRRIHGSTTYAYSAICAINPGQYTIVNNSNSCRTNWWSIPQDHTGNPNGYFMMVDGNNQRNEFYRRIITGLKPSLRYQFSAWCGNLISASGLGVDPFVKFEIHDANDNTIASSGSIDIAFTSPFQWQQVSFMFDVPYNFSGGYVVLIDQQNAALGNDIVLDDISFAPCYPPILASFSNSDIVDKAHTCNSGTVNLYGSWPSTIPFTNAVYQWQRSTDNGNSWADIPNATSISYTQTENTPMAYQYRLLSHEASDPSKSVTSNTLTYYVQAMVVDAITTDLHVCSGPTATTNLTGSGHLQYADPADNLTYSGVWSPSTYISDANSLSTSITIPVSAPPDNGPTQPVSSFTYTLTMTNTNYGCTASNTQTIAVHYPRKVYVPNAFTPDFTSNKLFRPINIEDYTPGARFTVYNRWGNVVFNSEGRTIQDFSWDGTYKGQPQDPDTYVWEVYLPFCRTRIYSSTNGDGASTGNVILIR